MSFAVSAVAMAVAMMSTSPALEQCRALDAEFNTRAMVKPCQAAADDAALLIPERVEALRRLAVAHIQNGEEALAELVFLRMFVFSPSAALPDDAGPRFRQVFAAARKRFLAEGKVRASFTPPTIPEEGPVRVTVDVADRLGRVMGARIVAEVSSPTSSQGAADSHVAVREDRLTQSVLTPGILRFSGPVPVPEASSTHGSAVAWRVVLEGWDGNEIAVDTPVAGRYARAVLSEDGRGSAALPWIAGGVGGAVVLAGVAGSIAWCVAAGPCRAQDAWVRVQLLPSSSGAP